MPSLTADASFSPGSGPSNGDVAPTAEPSLLRDGSAVSRPRRCSVCDKAKSEGEMVRGTDECRDCRCKRIMVKGLGGEWQREPEPRSYDII